MTAHVELARRERERADEAGSLRRLGEATSRLARVSDAAELESELCEAACDLAGADGAVLWTATPDGMLVATSRSGSDIAGAELPPGHGAGTRHAFDHSERSTARAPAARRRRAGARRCSRRWRSAIGRWAC